MGKPSTQATNRQNWLLAIGVVSLVVLPLVFVKGQFGGSDNQAKQAIGETHPDYKPWFTPLFKPTSPEIESLLFASQAALGAGVMGYVIGRYRGKQERSESPKDRTQD